MYRRNQPMPTCQICGIGFDTGRLRTPAEPRGAGWHSRGPMSTGGFLHGDGHFGIPTMATMADGRDRLCPRSSGCMVAKRWKKSASQIPDDPRLVDNYIQREVEVGAEGDYHDLYVDEFSEEDDPYEYDSSYESDSGSSVASHGNAATLSSSPNATASAASGQSQASGTIHAQAMIPVHDKPMVNLDYEDFNYEHISGGPNCQWKVDKRLVLNGHYISADDMRGCNTAQCLVVKAQGWVSEPDDEAFEASSNMFFLSGLCYRWARDGNWRAAVCPPRHRCTEVKALNNIHLSEGAGEPAMVFHPTCREVFKRVSMLRSGMVDYDALSTWWSMSSGDGYDKFPRDEAVGRALSYRNRPGDEWVVANPCFISKLAPIVAASDRSDDSNFGLNTTVFGEARKAPGDTFARLPRELLLMMLDPLDSKDIANLRLASRSFYQLPQSVFRTLILRECPWLWEAWSSVEYSKWAHHQPSELFQAYEQQKLRAEVVRQAETVLGEEASIVDDPEPYHAAITALREEAARDEGARHNYPASPAPLRFPEKIDWYHLSMELHHNRLTLPGLRNRQRIWRECGLILDRIANHRAYIERYTEDSWSSSDGDFPLSDDNEY
ncbi:hypothetical protein G7054_g1643 [Neopestalotiopsis clavispora]|nr:hypothetical protein G7054_g1643 [Neopestalotiopsis clavispora]